MKEDYGHANYSPKFIEEESTAKRKKTCDCKYYNHQVCDICQGITGNEEDKDESIKEVDTSVYIEKKTFIKIKTQFEALHNWPTAPKEVSHLRHSHRHTFYITLQIEVYHNDRELEFFMVKDRIEKEVVDLLDYDLKQTSCEDLNDLFYEALRVRYGGNRFYKIETSEDNQRSAISYYRPKE